MKINNYQEAEKAVKAIGVKDGRILEVSYKDESVPETLPGIPGRPLPAYCDVRIELNPSPKSRILVELWLPIENWNGDFLGTGNGGAAGQIVTLELANGLRRGYATANTDMGTAPNVDELIGEPERWIDFGYRATHLMTVVGKQITEAFYGYPPKVSLFIGGSTGGQQALMEAQRYPDDYDGILAIAPAYNRTHLHYAFIWNWLALTKNADSSFTAEQAKTVTDFILEQYGEKGCRLPGDHFFTCPNHVSVDPSIFEKCAGLNDAQREALATIVQGPIDSVTGKRILTPLYTPGSEADSMGLSGQSERDVFARDFFYLFRWVYGKDFDFTGFDFHLDVKNLDEILAEHLNATNPDLSLFRRGGGKLLMLHGMADPIIPYRDSLEYYQQVIEHDGAIEITRQYFRYFMVPGLSHVVGGPGVQDITAHGFLATPKDSEHDALVALSNWVKRGEAPERLLAVAFEDGNLLNGIIKDTYAYERPCFAYPACAFYVSGDKNDPNSYQEKTFDIV